MCYWWDENERKVLVAHHAALLDHLSHLGTSMQHVVCARIFDRVGRIKVAHAPGKGIGALSQKVDIARKVLLDFFGDVAEGT